MPTEIEALDAYIEAARAILNLPLELAWQAAVRANLEVTLAHARNVQSLRLPDEAEPASVFEV